MSSNPNIPRDRYYNCGDREWTRLDRDGRVALKTRYITRLEDSPQS